MVQVRLGGGVSIVLGLLGFGVLNGCGTADAKSDGPKGANAMSEPISEARSDVPRVVPDASEATRAAASEDEFGLDLLQLLAAEDSNLVFSPHSISTAFAMLTDAAAGETLAEITDTLHFGTIDEAFQRSEDALALELSRRNRGEIDDANGHVDPQILTQSNDVWIRNDAPPAASYLDTLAQFYGAGVQEADFAREPEQARVAINDKVSADTHGLIPDLIPQGDIDAGTVTVLTNALYFKAPWATPFAAPTPGSFRLENGSTVSAGMLAGEGDWLYYAGSGFVSVAVPYYGGDLELMLIVPDLGTYDAFRASMTSSLLEEVVANRTSTLVALSVPKVSIKSVVPTVNALEQLGMRAPFGPNAEFPKLTSPEFPSVHITDVLHQATLGIDETETEASAATAIAGGKILIVSPDDPEPQPLVVNVDRPFLFALRDQAIGALLFLGQVVAPDPAS